MSKAHRTISAAMGMDSDKWLRHANKWSVWSRLAAVPLFPLAIWARSWIGWPGTVISLVGIALWLWLNVRLFAPATSDQSWEARAILGEKMWLDRKVHTIPAEHLRFIARLNIGSALMLLPTAFGAIVFDFWAASLGACGLVVGQLWALDRYSWIYADLTRGLDEEKRMALAFTE